MYTKRHFWFVGLFGADPPINLLKCGPNDCAKIVEGIKKTVIRAPREFKKRNWWFQYRPEFVEGITQMVISELIPVDRVNRVTGRDTEPTFYTRRGPR